MSIAPSESPTWSFVQWSLTGLATLAASAGAFVWRLLFRIEKWEAAQTQQRADLDDLSGAVDAALSRLTERAAQMHDDHFRLRETIGALPTRSDLRDLEDRLVERLNALGGRLDRAIDP